MKDLTLKSSLSMEEMKANFKNIDFFSKLMEGLQEALDYQRGNVPESTVVHIVEV